MHVDLDALVRLQRTLCLLERRGILQPEGNRLECLAAEYRHELFVLTPDLRLERRAARAELADNVPIPTSEAQLVADHGVVIASDHLAADADLGAPGCRPPPLDDVQVGAHFPRFVADAADDNVADSIAVAAGPMERHEDVHFRADERMPVGSQRDVRRRRDEACRLTVDATRELGVGPATEDERIAR